MSRFKRLFSDSGVTYGTDHEERASAAAAERYRPSAWLCVWAAKQGCLARQKEGWGAGGTATRCGQGV